jgi:hypothetical protein
MQVSSAQPSVYLYSCTLKRKRREEQKSLIINYLLL